MGHLRSAAVGGAVAILVADKNTAPGAVAAPAIGEATIVAVAAELCPECKESGYFFVISRHRIVGSPVLIISCMKVWLRI